MERVYLDCSSLPNSIRVTSEIPQSIYVDGNAFVNQLQERIWELREVLETQKKEKERRKVHVKIVKTSPYPEDRSVTEFDATFIMYGNDFYEFDAGPANYTIAIVERENGKVEKVPVDSIQFLPKIIELEA